VIELVDSEDKLRAFAAGLTGAAEISLITLEQVEVLHG
jgi:PII-like signaling protein